MNKTWVIKLKLTNLKTAIKKFTDKKPGARFTVVGTRVVELEVKCPTPTLSFHNFPTMTA